MPVKSAVRSLLLASLAAVSFSALADVKVSGAYVREPMPGRDMSAAFMTITNDGTADKVLVSASAPWTGSIEIHTHIHDNGVMRMRQIESLTVPAGDSVQLQPGGLHLMLFGLKTPLAQTLPLQLCFADQSCIAVEAQLQSMK